MSNIETNLLFELSNCINTTSSTSVKSTLLDEYNKFLDSFGRKDNYLFFKEFKDNYDEFKIIQNTSFEDIQIFSFLNFARYQLYLKKYLKKLSCYPNWNKGILSITFENNNLTSTNFQLIFQSNGLVRFLSLDKDHDENETLSYVIDGSFSSSSLISKSYKIKRLLGILVEILNENNPPIFKSDNHTIRNLNQTNEENLLTFKERQVYGIWEY